MARHRGLRVVPLARGRGVRAGSRARGRELQAARRAPARRADRGLAGLLELQLGAVLDVNREDFALDPLSVGLDEGARLLRKREHDPVGELEALLLAERVHAIDELVRLALEHELVVEAEIERDRDAVARGNRPPLAPSALDEYLVGLELAPGDAEPTLRQLLELARRERLADGSELLAELRAELGQVRLHAQLDRLDGAELDVLDTQLVCDLFDVPVERRSLDHEPSQRLPQLDPRAGTRLPPQLHDPAHIRDLVEQPAIRLGHLGPTCEV